MSPSCILAKTPSARVSPRVARALTSLTLGLAAFLATTALSPAPAAADLGTVELHVGALRLDQGADPSYRPVVRGGLGFEVVGPLHLGAYVQLTGYELPLRTPQPGGGIYLSLRPRLPLLRVRPSVDASVGRLRLPQGRLDEQPRAEVVHTFVVGAAGNLGVAVSRAVTLEVRVEYSRFFATDARATLGDHSVALLAGMTIHVP